MSIFRHLNPNHKKAKRGRKFTFHGQFKDKQVAMAKEREVHGFIREVERGKRGQQETYYMVLTEN